MFGFFDEFGNRAKKVKFENDIEQKLLDLFFLVILRSLLEIAWTGIQCSWENKRYE